MTSHNIIVKVINAWVGLNRDMLYDFAVWIYQICIGLKTQAVPWRKLVYVDFKLPVGYNF